MEITFLPTNTPKIHLHLEQLLQNTYCTLAEDLNFPKDDLRQPTCRGGAKCKAEPQELCEQRREKEISPSSLRSSGLNLHNQLDVHCISGIPEQAMNHLKIEAVDFGSNCRLGVSFLHLICFWFLCLSQFSIQSLLSLVDLFIDLVAIFLFLKYSYIFFLLLLL